MAFVLKPRQPVFFFVPENLLVHALHFRTAKDLYDRMLCVANSGLDLHRCKIRADEHVKTRRVPVKILIRVMNRTIDRRSIGSERLFVPHITLVLVGCHLYFLVKYALRPKRSCVPSWCGPPRPCSSGPAALPATGGSLTRNRD